MAVYNVTASGGANDANQKMDGTGFTSGGTTANMDSNTSNGSRYIYGIRFASVPIPRNALVGSATLSFNIASTKSDDANCDIFCEAVDNAVDFSTNADVYQRSLTSTSGTWVLDNLGAGSETTSSFAAPLQEVFARSGWVPGNALCIIIRGRSDTNKVLQAGNIDAGGVQIPQISITYDAPASIVGQYIRAGTLSTTGNVS